MLKPETSSDSLSVKSKGVRLVSAKIVIIHTAIIGTRINFVVNITSFNFKVLRLFGNTIIARIKIAIETSYEIACAVARYLPRMENFLFDAHPDDIENIIVIDITATRYRIARVIFAFDLEFGKIIHIMV